MQRSAKVLVAVSFGLLASLLGATQLLKAEEPSAVTALDILLEPDATMIKRARAANERLLKSTSRVCSGT